MPLSPAEALNKAAAYCTLCERCTSEVSNKLTAWGVAHTDQRAIIERLQSEGFIDEGRYCRAFVNDKVRFNHWGKIKIVAALREKRLPAEDIAAAIEQIDEKEYTQALQAVISLKQKELKGKDDYAARQKIVRFAASRGFEPARIFKIINCEGYEVDF
ncbi:MAG: RecX family transcriptional regulator [Bacteroidaceae bacterium]|nr:RecX family transcriptional regulator [Bacteroidaceae bacterium]